MPKYFFFFKLFFLQRSLSACYCDSIVHLPQTGQSIANFGDTSAQENVRGMFLRLRIFVLSLQCFQ